VHACHVSPLIRSTVPEFLSRIPVAFGTRHVHACSVFYNIVYNRVPDFWSFTGSLRFRMLKRKGSMLNSVCMHLALANFMRARLYCLRTEMAEYSVFGYVVYGCVMA